MLKDSLPSYQSPKSSDFSVEQDVEVNLILSFIDNYISDFSGYYLSLNDSEKENRISDLLVHYLEICKDESKGYFVDTPKIRAVSLIIKFTEYDTKKVYPEVQDQSGIGSLERAA